MEEETALSIIDPVTLQIDLTSNKILQVVFLIFEQK